MMLSRVLWSMTWLLDAAPILIMAAKTPVLIYSVELIFILAGVWILWPPVAYLILSWKDSRCSSVGANGNKETEDAC